MTSIDFFGLWLSLPIIDPQIVLSPRRLLVVCMLFQFEPVDSCVVLVLSLLTKLDTRKSTGPDDLSALFLQRVAECIVVPLTLIYNKSLKTGTVPSAWKKSNVTPVHKGGDTDDPGNYRPISVVPIVAKILEKIIAIQLGSYMEHHHLLHDLQGAYRHGRSADQILLYATDNYHCSGY